MPYGIVKMKHGFFVVNKETGKKFNKVAHPTKEKAMKHLAAIEIHTHGK